MIRSARFDDIYFSAEDGLAETRHVFIDHNDLQRGWTNRDHFTIAETGFGTGLNFLAAWTLFEETAAPGAVLDYVSFELYPLDAARIGEALAHWSDAFGGRLERMVAAYPLRIPGWHRVDFGRVRLTLVFDDVNAALPRVTIPRGVDAWFLDGFAPAKNPQMWTGTVFEHMARLSHADTTLASFTAAGIVKNGLRDAGFAIEKCKGYGRKRDMIAGRFTGQGTGAIKPGAIKQNHCRVAIIGGGLAGTACARVLRHRGIAHTLFDAAPTLAAGASGNAGGIFNPRFSAQRAAESDFYSAAFALAARALRDDPTLLPCGSLHLIIDDDKRKRFTACAANWGWPADHMRIVDAAEASALAGIPIAHDALFLPDSGQISPRHLCHAWADGSDIVLNRKIAPADLKDYDAVILACGAAVRDIMPDLPLQTVRGQILEAPVSQNSAGLKTNLCYGGYLGAARDGIHIAGSTFQKWLDTTDLRDEDNRYIFDRLEDAVPGLGLRDVTQARAALRCAAKDRFPVIGAVPGRPGWYLSAAHGSHGIISSLAGAHLIADMIEDGVQSLPQDSVNMLSPGRFF